MIDLRQGDALNVLKTIPDKSIDLVVIDPPYYNEANSKNGGGGAFGTKHRDYHKDYVELTKAKDENDYFDLSILDELDRVMKKKNIYIWCSKEQLKLYMDHYSDCYFNILTWHKTNPTPLCSNKYLTDTEYCLFFREKGVKIGGIYETKKTYWVTPTNKADKDMYEHPTIKPLDIIKNHIINSSNEGDTVLDCFMGSGTTGVACKELNRNFIGVELDPHYFEIANKRINKDTLISRKESSEISLF